MTKSLIASFSLFALLSAFAVSAHASQSLSAANLIDNGNGTFSDSVNGLTWQKTDDGMQRHWYAADDYCKNNTAGLPGSGWRLPTFEELKSIKGTPGLNAKFAFYWSSTHPNPESTLFAMGLDFGSGSISNGKKDVSYYVRCVRR